MFHAMTYNTALNNALYIDVRTNTEYLKGHIPGAINIPILEENEREEIGLLYKTGNVSEAKRKGILYGSKKLNLYFDFLDLQKKDFKKKHIVFYCARGGYRSRSVSMTLKSIDLPVYWLEGGYKKYRNQVNAFFDLGIFPNFIVLHGLSGVGKTSVLKSLKALNGPILDLEACANHKGSHLGSIGTDGLQSQQNFENAIYESIKSLGKQICFIESESKRIGQVYIPSTLFNHIKKGTHVLLSASLEHRVKTLLNEYEHASNFKSVLTKGIDRLKPYLQKEDYVALTKAFDNASYSELARLLLEKHYDPIYQKSIINYTYDTNFSSESPAICAEMLMNTYISSTLSQ